MPLMVKDKAMVPHPGLWKLAHPDGGFEVRHPELVQVYRQMRAYCKANDKPVPIMEEMDVWLCEQNPQLCVDETTKAPPFSQRVKQFFGEMANWVKEGFPVVSKEVLQARTETCSGGDGKARCDQWRGFSGSFIGGCGSCRCTGIKLFLATESCPLKKWKA